MSPRRGRLVVLAVGFAAVAAAAVRVARRSPPVLPRPVLTLPRQVRRRGPGQTEPGAEDLTDRPVPRSVAALSTPPHFEQQPDPDA